jgi:hypothetical protein
MNTEYTWLDFVSDITVTKISHPIYGIFDKQEFINIYGEAMKNLDGTTASDYVSFYYERNPVDNSHLCFQDEDAELDIRDLLIEFGTDPELQEICEGSPREQKKTFTIKVDIPKKEPKQKKKRKPMLTIEHLIRCKLRSLETTLTKEPEKRNHDKIMRTINGLEEDFRKLLA